MATATGTFRADVLVTNVPKRAWQKEGTGAFLYWLARPGQRPDEWTVLCNEGRGPLWEHHDMGCLAFLLAVLTGTAETEYLGYLDDVLKPTEHRFATADQTLGTSRRATAPGVHRTPPPACLLPLACPVIR
ncbi:hypothetical protein [Streptomyces siamensis]|uniref:hypothetical protein n=1 Tax=Streptomyces siamensis TaxID=1274986 RepID=UPI0031EAA909